MRGGKLPPPLLFILWVITLCFTLAGFKNTDIENSNGVPVLFKFIGAAILIILTIMMWRGHPACNLFFGNSEECGKAACGVVVAWPFSYFYFCPDHEPRSRWMQAWLKEKRKEIRGWSTFRLYDYHD